MVEVTVVALELIFAMFCKLPIRILIDTCLHMASDASAVVAAAAVVVVEGAEEVDAFALDQETIF